MLKFAFFALAFLATGIPASRGEPLRCYVGSDLGPTFYLNTPDADACFITFNLLTMQPTMTFHEVSGRYVKTPELLEYERRNAYNCGVFPYQYLAHEPHGMMIRCACYTIGCNKPVDYETFIYSGRNITWKRTFDSDVTSYFP